MRTPESRTATATETIGVEVGAGQIRTRPRRGTVARSVRKGILASVGLALAWVAIVAGASGSVGHMIDQALARWYFLAPIVAGFGVQVGLVSELRGRHQMHHGAAAAGAAGTGASTAGMIACCAHHIADLAPFVGATGTAAFLTEYQVPLMAGGLVVSLAGIAVTGRRLHSVQVVEGGPTCAPE